MTVRSEWMFDVAVKRKFLDPVTQKSEWRFVKRSINDVKKEDSYRCLHCKGEIKLHQGSKAEWYADHKDLWESTKCPGIVISAETELLLKRKKVE